MRSWEFVFLSSDKKCSSKTVGVPSSNFANLISLNNHMALE